MLLWYCIQVEISKTVHASGGEQQLVPLVSYAVAWQNVSAADAFPYDNALKYMSATMHIWIACMDEEIYFRFLSICERLNEYKTARSQKLLIVYGILHKTLLSSYKLEIFI